jgi:small subunit ribosomal protein S21
VQSVTRKEHEAFESLMRRFNRKVQQSGDLPVVRRKQYFEKPLSKREVRAIAIRKKARKDAKNRQQLIRGY